MPSVMAIVLGGGAGTRLFPLTHVRSKPAVPFAGKYRIIDVPVSNCLNSGYNRIFILTQFNSASLNQHVSSTYRFSLFSRGFVDILAAEQTPFGQRWFQGTADAVRQTLHHLHEHSFDVALILSGDQLYQMDIAHLVQSHVDSDAEVTVATTPVTAEEATGFGIMKTDARGQITEFVEKPPADQLGPLRVETAPEMMAEGREYLASMGIYVFDREALFGLLSEHSEMVDFGKDIIPLAISERPVFSHAYSGYWTDIGTIKSFFAANLELTDPLPRLDLYDAENPIYTHPRMLPPAKLQRCSIDGSVVTPGCILEGCEVRRSVIGVRTVIGEGANLDECVIMGAAAHESSAARKRNEQVGLPDIGIGAGSRLKQVIVDRNARIGRDVVIEGNPDRPDEDGEDFHVRDGIIVIPKDAVIPDGAVV
ncbi:MAG: glucose-1-phosphate adenylyltransferase [Acidobacteriota bacterium]